MISGPLATSYQNDTKMAADRVAASKVRAYGLCMFASMRGAAATLCFFTRGILAICLLSSVLLSSVLLSLPVQAQTTSLATIKAGLIYRFVQFTQWPSGSSPETPQIHYCVVGDTQVFDALGLLFSDTKRQQPMTTHWVTTPEQLRGCHVIYLATPSAATVSSGASPSTTGQAPEPKAAAIWQPYLQQSQAITIGDGAEWFRQGTLFGIITEPNRLSFRVNLTKAREQGFHLSAQMLKLAKEIH